MKSVLLIRHAKSSWDNVSQKDFDRPLNDRGHKDAPAMAKRILSDGIEIDAFISSPAVRALTTATYFAKAYGKTDKDIIVVKDLYEPKLPAFYNAIKNADDSLDSIAIFSHNPGITDFVNQLTKTKVDDMPTCAVFAIKVDIEHWKDFEAPIKKFWFFDYPKAKD